MKWMREHQNLLELYIYECIGHWNSNSSLAKTFSFGNLPAEYNKHKIQSLHPVLEVLAYHDHQCQARKSAQAFACKRIEQVMNQASKCYERDLDKLELQSCSTVDDQDISR